jgi:hypothetical protein
MASEQVLTQARLKELFHYCPQTGIFTRIKGAGGKTGSPAGYADSYGYLRIMIDRKMYKAHRLVWLYVYGKWPDCTIDHRNGIVSDNRMVNIREATRVENQQNLKKRSDNSTGFMNVSFNSKRKKFMSYINYKGKRLYLGSDYDTAEQAHTVFLQAKSEIHLFQPVPRQA